MIYQKKKKERNLLENISNQTSKIRTKNRLEIKMMIQEEHITQIVKLNLRLQC